MEVKERKSKFPKGFFSKNRPEITLEESLKDVIPVEWKEKSKKIIKNNVSIKNQKNSNLG